MTNKPELMNWLQGEYQNWKVLLDQIGTLRMDQPGVNGDWSMKDMVGHLSTWNRWLVTRLEAAQRAEPEPAPPWPGHLTAEDEINAWIYNDNHIRRGREVLEEMHAGFQQLIVAIEELPDDLRIERLNPTYYLVWINDKRFLAGEFFNHFHDDHEPDVRAWLRQIQTKSSLSNPFSRPRA